MGDTQNNNPESDEAVLTGGEFLTWYNGLADEIDERAAQLQARLDQDPRSREDPAFVEAETRLKAEQDLLERAGSDFSDLTVKKGVEVAIGRILTEAESE